MIERQSRLNYSKVLLKELVRTDFKLRYQGSTLGYVWSLLRPLLMFTILYFVFVKFVKSFGDIQHPQLYLLLGIILWNYFVEVTSGSIGAIVGKGDLLRKIDFPKYVIILAITASALINLSLNFVVLGVFMLFAGVQLTPSMLLIFPLVLELIIISMGFSFLLSAVYVKLRDVTYIWDVVMQAGFYLTPILYLVTILPGAFAKLALLNPMAQLIQDARWAFVSNATPTIYSMWGHWYWWAVPIVAALAVFYVGIVYFRAHSSRFAEDV